MWPGFVGPHPDRLHLQALQMGSSAQDGSHHLKGGSDYHNPTHIKQVSHTSGRKLHSICNFCNICNMTDRGTAGCTKIEYTGIATDWDGNFFYHHYPELASLRVPDVK